MGRGIGRWAGLQGNGEGHRAVGRGTGRWAEAGGGGEGQGDVQLMWRVRERWEGEGRSV